ncbi:MAG: phytanoyl-CoA dioxygenase family protein [Actinobacteria bacterium]|nr:phytanoyl-CoA dioxygenase family protein [Actinomycetota bacterium]
MTTSTEFSLTAEEEALLPSDDDVRFYAEHGWYLSGKLFTDAEIDALVAASDDYYDGARDHLLPSRPAKIAYWEPSKGDVQRHNDYVHYESDGIAKILRKPLVGAVAARLAQAEEIRIFQSTMIYKPPVAAEPTNVVPWHFDKHYWSCCSSDKMLTAFIPFHDCTVEMGTITMVDGSHRWREIGSADSQVRHFAERDKAELDVMLAENAAFNGAEVVKVPMEIPKGHMSFHHCRTYHGSGPNLSDRPRRAISLHLQDGDNAFREFRLSTGALAGYNHDSLVRRTAEGHPDYSDQEYCPTLWRS